MINLKIDKTKMVGYLIHETADGTCHLCRIIKEYDNSEEAEQDLVKLLVHKVTEKELSKKR